MKKKIILGILIAVCVLVLGIGVLGTYEIKDYLAAGDVCEQHLVHDCDVCNAVSEGYIHKDGPCRRCQDGIIESVCCEEILMQNAVRYRQCDDPSHSKECMIEEVYCYTNYACIGCVNNYFNSGSEEHLESIIHSDTGTVEEKCVLPKVPLP